MYKSIILLSILFYSVNVYGQTVNGKKLTDIKETYIKIVAIQKGIGSKVTIKLEYGQELKASTSIKDHQIKDEYGKVMIFNSLIDVFNFIRVYNYEYKTSYVSRSIQNFIFEKIE